MSTYLTPYKSDLYLKVHKIHHISARNNYVRLKATIYYKSNDDVCYWLCPYGQAKNFKLRKDVYDSFKPYQRG